MKFRCHSIYYIHCCAKINMNVFENIITEDANNKEHLKLYATRPYDFCIKILFIHFLMQIIIVFNKENCLLFTCFCYET